MKILRLTSLLPAVIFFFVAPRSFGQVGAASGHSTEAVPKSGGDWRRFQEVGPLQEDIEKLAPGATLTIPKGLHLGPVVIRTPGITIRGEDGARISGQGKGSVVVIAAANVTIENLSIENTGTSHDQVDAGISVRDVRKVLLKKLLLSNCLFGVDISGSQEIRLTESRISSKEFPLGLRGDAIRVFASRDVIVDNNEWHDTRDAVVWYSNQVHIESNRSSRSRYSVHSMYSKNLFIQDNNFYRNTVGIFIMYGEFTTVLNNVVSHSMGPTGMGLGMKETSALFAQGNSFLYCATGVLVDNSPLVPGLKNWFFKNKIAFNGIGVLFSNAKPGNIFQHNRFKDNLADVDTESRRTSESDWRDNYWDQYQGFDQNGDKIGDQPHRVYKYPDLIAANHPLAGFFNGSPILLLISLVEKLLPVASPMLVVEDSEPRLSLENSND